MKQNIRVHALPTEKASNNGIIRSTHQPKDWKNYNSSLYGNKIKEVGFDGSTKEWQPYHLYITTDETPKEGDWFIDTRDSYLGIYKCTGQTSNFAFSCSKEINHPIEYCRKVVATDDKILLPLLSPEFQQAWVRNMNAGTPIVDAIMEMNEIQPNLCDCYYTKFCKSTQLAEGVTCKDQDIPRIYTPKLNSQGYVTILPVKDNKFTPEEKEAIKRFQNGEKWSVSTFIDEDSIIAGYGDLDHDFEFPLPVVYIKAIYGSTSWTKVFEEDKRKAELLFPVNQNKEEKLKQLADLLESRGLRKYTCINGFGYSQIERDIVDLFLPVKEKMYTSEEVEILCRKAMLMYKGNNEGYPGLIKSSKKKEDKWIEDNL